MSSSLNTPPKPLVSVVIPAHNSAATIMRALESVWRQDYRPLELIVVDDGSSDSTRDVVLKCEGRGVKAIFLEKLGGASVARNVGVQAASGDYIAFLDSDDEWLDTKLSKQMDVIAADDRMTFVACGAVLVDPDGVKAGPLYPGRPPVVGGDAWKTLLAYTFVATPCVLARRKAILDVGGFDPAFPIAEDQDLWIRLALHGPLGYVDEVLVRVYTTANSLSARYATEGAERTLPIITRHIAANRRALSRREVNRILGTRYSGLGRNAYFNRQYSKGIRYVGQAILMGHRPLENVWYLASASPLSRWLKGRFAVGASPKSHVGT